MQAFVLCGGLGTRLAGMLGEQPKPMAPIAGRPFLEYLLAYLKRHGLREVVLCLGYRAEAIAAHFGDGGALGMRIAYSREDAPLGTGGAFRQAASLLVGDHLLAMNGDSLFDMDLADLVAYHHRQHALATIALAQVPDTSRYGSVEVDPQGRIRRFLEKRAGGGPGLINSGVYVFQRQVLDRIPAGRAVSLEREVFPGLMGSPFYGLPFAGRYFVDIGVPQDLLSLQADPSPLQRASAEEDEQC